MISEERIRQLQKQGYIPKAEKRGVAQLSVRSKTTSATSSTMRRVD